MCLLSEFRPASRIACMAIFFYQIYIYKALYDVRHSRHKMPIFHWCVKLTLTFIYTIIYACAMHPCRKASFLHVCSSQASLLALVITHVQPDCCRPKAGKADRRIIARHFFSSCSWHGWMAGRGPFDSIFEGRTLWLSVAPVVVLIEDDKQIIVAM